MPTPPADLKVRSVFPNVGPTVGATNLTIFGAGFKAGLTVTIDGAAVATADLTATSVVVTTAAHGEGAVDIVVIDPDGKRATLAGGYTYAFIPPPVVTSVSPGSGSTVGGVTLNITGTGFAPGFTLTIGGVITISGLLSAGGPQTVYVVTAPPGAAGPVDVVVRNPDGQSSTLKNGFTYVLPASFDFNGDWEGFTRFDANYLLYFTIQNNAVVSASCTGSPNFVSTPVPVLSSGVFTVTGNGETISGMIVGDGSAVGSISGPFCSDDGGWSAVKKKG
jgi:hypothetical protein